MIRSTATGSNDCRPPKCGSLNPPSSSTGASPAVAHISAPVSSLISASAAVWSQWACVVSSTLTSSSLNPTDSMFSRISGTESSSPVLIRKWPSFEVTRNTARS